MDETGDKQAIKQAIDTIVNNFSKHAHLHGHGKSKSWIILIIY
jgi:hypothetical protein